METRTSISTLTVTLAVVCSLFSASVARGTEWTGAEDTNWHNPNNWTDGIPTSDDSLQSWPDDAEVDIFEDEAEFRTFGVPSSGFIMNISNDLTIFNTSAGIPEGSGTDAVVNLKEGTFLSNNDIILGHDGGTGTFNMDDGTTLRVERDLHLGQNGGTGTFNMDGGTLHNYDPGRFMRIGTGSGSTGTFNMYGGEIIANAFYVAPDGGTGLFNMEGGSLEGDHAFRVYSGGTFRVSGSNPESIEFSGSRDVEVNGTLDFRIDDTAEGITPIEQTHSGQQVIFDDAELDVSFLDWPGVTEETTWTVMTWDGDLVDNGLSFASGVNENIWSFNLDEGAKTLFVTAIPEPSSLLLLGLAGLLLMKRRRV